MRLAGLPARLVILTQEAGSILNREVPARLVILNPPCLSIKQSGRGQPHAPPLAPPLAPLLPPPKRPAKSLSSSRTGVGQPPPSPLPPHHQACPTRFLLNLPWCAFGYPQPISLPLLKMRNLVPPPAPPLPTPTPPSCPPEDHEKAYPQKKWAHQNARHVWLSST